MGRSRYTGGCYGDGGCDSFSIPAVALGRVFARAAAFTRGTVASRTRLELQVGATPFAVFRAELPYTKRRLLLPCHRDTGELTVVFQQKSHNNNTEFGGTVVHHASCVSSFFHALMQQIGLGSHFHLGTQRLRLHDTIGANGDPFLMWAHSFSDVGPHLLMWLTPILTAA
jgi:hypothetical protein